MATSPTPELAGNSLPVRTHTSSNSPVARSSTEEHEDTATRARDWRRQVELQAMDMEDVQVPATSSHATFPVNWNFSFNAQSMQQMRSRIDRRRLRRLTARKKFTHKIAIGFMLDEGEETKRINSQRFAHGKGCMEAKMSRRAVKQLMQRILPHVEAGDESEEDADEEKTRETTLDATKRAIWHQDLGEMLNAVAYVGKTGKIMSHGREFLQCERYGAQDVVGCGVLLDTNTFFFTLNGKLMGMLAAEDVGNLAPFRDVEDLGEEKEVVEEDESENEDWNCSDKEVNDDRRGRRRSEQGQDELCMEDGDECYEEKVMYPSVSLHGAGERVRAVFEPDEFQFDLLGFEQQVQKQRQRALLAERALRSRNNSTTELERMEAKDEATMNALVHNFFLHYGYANAYKSFEAVLTPLKRQCLPSDTTEVAMDDEREETNGVGSVEWMEDERKSEDTGAEDLQLSLRSIKQPMHESLSLRHEVREHIRCFRTAQALAVLEQHVPAIMTLETGSRSRQYKKLLLYCRILCVIDVLTHEDEAKAATSSSSVTKSTLQSPRSMNLDEGGCNGWNPESAIDFARQVFKSPLEVPTNGKRKRLELGRQHNGPDTHDVALAMSLLLYNQRDDVPESSRARKFLTSEFREAVADELNSLLLSSEEDTTSEPRVSMLETFMTDLSKLQRECLRQGCRVYPKSVETTSNGKFKTTACQWRAAESSSSDDSSSSQSDHEIDRLDDDDNE